MCSRNSTITTLLEFYFYCKVSEVEFVDQALQAVVSLGTIGSFTLMNTTATYVQSPGKYNVVWTHTMEYFAVNRIPSSAHLVIFVKQLTHTHDTRKTRKVPFYMYV